MGRGRGRNKKAGGPAAAAQAPPAEPPPPAEVCDTATECEAAPPTAAAVEPPAKSNAPSSLAGRRSPDVVPISVPVEDPSRFAKAPTPNSDEMRLIKQFELETDNRELKEQNAGLTLEVEQLREELAAARAAAAAADNSRRRSSTGGDSGASVDIARRCNELLREMGEETDDTGVATLAFGRFANCVSARLQSVAAREERDAAVMGAHRDLEHAVRHACDELRAVELDQRTSLEDKQSLFDKLVASVLLREQDAAKVQGGGNGGPPVYADLLQRCTSKTLMLEHYSGLVSKLQSDADDDESDSAVVHASGATTPVAAAPVGGGSSWGSWGFM